MAARLNFSLTQLEYFIAVKRHGHFAKAAEACHITQPTLSMQIQKLEESLGVILFDRTKKPILLTQAGEKLFSQVQSVIYEAKKIPDIVEAEHTEGTHGELTLAIIPTIAPYLLPRLLPVIEKRFRQITLTILELQTHQIVDALNNDEIDVGILATPLKIPQLFERPLYYEPFYILCRKGHELAQRKRVKYSQLKFNDIWLLKEGHCLRHQVLDVCSVKEAQTSKRKFKFESGSLETLVNLVESYGGYTLLPQLATEKLRGPTQLLEFEKPIPAREVGLVYRREHYKTNLIDALSESITQCLPSELQNTSLKNLDVIPVS